MRRALKGHAIPHINRVVDTYNAVSLETLLPAGAEDLAAIEGDVELAIAGEASRRSASSARQKRGPPSLVR